MLAFCQQQLQGPGGTAMATHAPSSSCCAAGKSGGRLRDNDVLEEVVAAMSHDHVLFLTATGKLHCIKAYKIPEASRTASGTAIAQVRVGG